MKCSYLCRCSPTVGTYTHTHTHTHTYTHTHPPSLIQQRVDERACSCGWRMGDEEGEDGRMGGCWVSERGCGERGQLTDRQQKTSTAPKFKRALSTKHLPMCIQTFMHTPTNMVPLNHPLSTGRSVFSHTVCGFCCAL